VNFVIEKNLKRKAAFSLVEMLVVIGIIAILVGLAIPAIKVMQKSFNSTGAEGLISAALATARTLAISHQQYAGVRFQKAYSEKGPLEANQYMIFIIYDEDKSGLTCGFIAVEGYKPMKLPENVSVIDKMVRADYDPAPNPCNQIHERALEEPNLNDSVPENLDPNNNNRNITDISVFSIVFSPAGKLVIHEVICRNRNAANRDDDTGSDDIFNTKNNIEANPPVGMFIQDDFDDYGIGVENSRREFYIYDRTKFKDLTTGSQRMIYLDSLKPMYVNPYTGEIIKN
jgi:prepilin-type N-terminal cleavage/methylation domain-containing protein